MQAREAYEALCAAISADRRKRIIERRYDEQHFGSFAVSFEEDGEARCVVNDRGFLFVTEQLDGTGRAMVMVASLREKDAKSLLQALNL